MIRILSVVMQFGGMGLAVLVLFICLWLIVRRVQPVIDLIGAAGALAFGGALAAGLFRQSCGPACTVPAWDDLLVLAALLLLFTAFLIGRIQRLKDDGTQTADTPGDDPPAPGA